MLRFATIIITVFALSCAPELIQRPIPFPEERLDLTLAYMEERHGLEAMDPFIEPRIVVVHWTAIDDLESSWKAFEATRIPGSRTGIAGASDLNVSAQFLIDQDGVIFQLMPDTLFARHTIGLNYTAVGIENVGGRNLPLTRKQFRSNFWLIRNLMMKYPIEHVIGHHEYQRFRGTPFWKETDPDYLTTKTDPGDKFMEKLRRKLDGVPGPPN